MQYPYLFTPIRINGLELQNRIVMTAMHLGYTPEGEVTERLIDFYVPRARGGAGLIIVGGCPIDEYGGMANMIRLDDDRFIAGLQRLTSAVKAAGSPIAAQLYQAGRYTHSAMIGGRKPFSASAVRSRLTGETPRALEQEEIPAVQDRFAEAAVRARRAGFDAVEILASAGYLISQFLSPVTNLRDDAYGGSLENRMRFGIEVVQKVRSAVGPDYPLLVRLAGNEFMEGGNRNPEICAFAAVLQQAGADMFDVTGGWHETRVPQLTMFVPRRAYVYLAQGIKAAVQVPVLASNRINDPETAEEILRNGEADLVTMARGLLADPDLPHKAREGRAHLIDHCIACNQGCFDSIFNLKAATCLVNPRAGHEGEWRVEPAARPKRVLVIGGGPAGMKCARTAAERGHQVILAEKSRRLGGQLQLNRRIPGRQEMATAAHDLIHHLGHLKVELRLGEVVTAARVKEWAPEAVVIATGAVPQKPPLPGIDRPQVVQSWDVLDGRVGVGRRVVIIGGNAVGLETALYLAQQGTLPPEVLHFLMANRAEPMETLLQMIDRGNKEVVVLEMLKRAGKDIGQSTRWTVMAELQRLGVSVMTNTRAVAVKDGFVEVEKDGQSEELPADSVVIAAGSLSERGLAAALEGLVPEIHVIGDAAEPRKALEAVREGFLTGLKL